MSRKKTKSSGGSSRVVEPYTAALDALRRGEVIVFPTETFYGLGADALDRSAVEQVVDIKGREPDKPIPILVADWKMLESVVADIPAVARRLMDCFWPGPLTVVLTARGSLPSPLVNRRGGVGVRISSHFVATRLVKELGRPITATSANLSGQAPARSHPEALAYLSGRVATFLDGGRLEGTLGSTVVEILENDWSLIREGEISSAQLANALS